MRRYKVSPDHVIHVGAWEGRDVPEYKFLRIPKITLVEAMPTLAGFLRKKFESDEQIQIIEAAASDKGNRTVTFYPLDYGSSSTLKPKIESLQRFFSDFKKVEPISVKSIKIDELQIFEAKKIMLVIDVQGAELQVLRGSIETLKNTVLLKVEVSTTAYYEGQSFQSDVSLFLKNAGFVKVSQRVSKKMGQGDAIFLRKGHASIASIILGKIMDLRWRLSIKDSHLHSIGFFSKP